MGLSQHIVLSLNNTFLVDTVGKAFVTTLDCMLTGLLLVEHAVNRIVYLLRYLKARTFRYCMKIVYFELVHSVMS